jgi:hypothetical protein
VEQANQANQYKGRDGKTDGAFKQHPPTLRAVQRIGKSNLMKPPGGARKKHNF